MNRRAFLKRFGIGVSAALTLAALPETAIRALSVTDAGKRIASEYLRKRFNEHVSGRGLDGFPLAMHVPRGLFEAFEGEITVCERFCDASAPSGERSLMFKGTALFADPTMPKAWDVRFTERPPRAAEYAMNTTGAVYA